MRNAAACWVAVLGLIVPVACASIVYVDDDAPPGGNGQSWTTSFTFLQDALAAAHAGDEIRVAGGVYYPDRDAANPIGTGDRYATFNLVSAVAIYGGYAGLSMPSDPDHRDLQLYPATLSGNINSPTNKFDNSRHVVMGSGIAQGTLVDGLTITAGSGSPEVLHPATNGMGLYLSTGALILRGCSIKNNLGGPNPGLGLAGKGAGIYCEQFSLDLVDCTIADNVSGDGADYLSLDEFGGDSLMVDAPGDFVVPELSVVPADGGVGGDGGGIFATGNSLIRAVSCKLIDNRTGHGGYASHPNLGGRGGRGAGIYLETSARLEALNCLICGGRTGSGGATQMGFGGDGGNGAGIYVDASSSVNATNCLIAGNHAGDGNNGYSGGGDGGSGGGIYTMGVEARLTNCTLFDNAAGHEGTGYYGNGQPGRGGALYCANVATVVTNSILWLATPEAVFGQPSITYSDVQGGWSSLGDISGDPLFVDVDGPDNDPNTWADNDFRLSGGSPCIDAGSNPAMPRDVYDLDGDGCVTEPLPVDLDGYARYIDDPNTPDTGLGAAPLVDMGAYEFGATQPPVGGPCTADLNCDGVVDFDDINPFVLALSDPVEYQAIYPNCFISAGDCNNDGAVNFDDIEPFVALLSR